MNRLVCCLCLICLINLTGVPLAAQDLSSDQSRALEQDMARYEALIEERRAEQARIRDTLGETEAALGERIAERDRISAQLSTLRQEREALQNEVAGLETELEATEARIAEQQARLETLQGRLQALVVNLHRQRAGAYARLLSQAESFHELQVKQRYLARLAEQDVTLLDELNTTVANLRQDQAQRLLQVEALGSREQALAVTQAELQTAQASLESVIAELESTQAGQLALRQNALADEEQFAQLLGFARRDYQTEVARLELQERQRQEAERRRVAAEAAAARAEARARQATPDPTPAPQPEAQVVSPALPEELASRAAPAPTPRTETAFAPPFDEARLLSRFGDDNRTYISLQAPEEGFAVRAVMSGQILVTQSQGANDGYAVAIQHVYEGNEMTSLYVGLQAPEVSVGDRVTQGQVIGYLGGGVLIPANILRFRIARLASGSRDVFIDPAPYLGFR